MRHRPMCNCVIDYNKPVPPNVINFDGRSPEARIADLEKRAASNDVRISWLEATLEQHESGGVFHAPLPPSQLEARIAAIEARHIKLLDCLIEYFT